MAGSSTRTSTWHTRANPSDLLTVMRALEPQLATVTEIIPQIRSVGYFLSSSDGNEHNLTSEELEDIFTQKTSVTSLQVRYDNYRKTGDRYAFQLWLNSYSSEVDVKLEVDAPRTDEATKLIQKLRNNIDIQIMRQNAAGWTAPPLAFPMEPQIPPCDHTPTSPPIKSQPPAVTSGCKMPHHPTRHKPNCRRLHHHRRRLHHHRRRLHHHPKV
jgi:hypothetical protein